MSESRRESIVVPSAAQPTLKGEDIDRWTLRFLDPALEAQFREHYFRIHLTNVRVAYVLGVALWVVWGVLVRDYLGDAQGFDLALRYGLFIPLLVVSLVLSFTNLYRRTWQVAAGAVLLVTGLAWIAYAATVREMPTDYGYVGVILIMTFGFTLVRLPFLIPAGVSGALILGYLLIGPAAESANISRLSLAPFYLVSFWVLGLAASYALERSTRLLYLRERQLDAERLRSDSLLLNVLPRAIVDRLKEREGEPAGRIADGIEQVTVLFADAVGFTGQGERTPPGALVGALDDLFSGFDSIADRVGLEKIKTAGDAYLAVAGAPTPHPDQVGAAAEMALSIQESVRGARWPSGDAIQFRVGIATGPVVAGVIGRRKFAYDLWGDTVNLASRLESHGEPGRILVSESVAEALGDRFTFSPSMTMDLKGKGPTRACFLVDRLRQGPGKHR